MLDIKHVFKKIESGRIEGDKKYNIYKCELCGQSVKLLEGKNINRCAVMYGCIEKMKK